MHPQINCARCKKCFTLSDSHNGISRHILWRWGLLYLCHVVLPAKVYVRRRITQREADFFVQFPFAFFLDVVCKAVRPNVHRRYGMHCFGTYFTHVQTCDNVRVQSATQWTASVHTWRNVQTCDNVRVQSATQWTASAHTLHMSKPVITFAFKVLRDGLLRYIRDACPNLW